MLEEVVSHWDDLDDSNRKENNYSTISTTDFEFSPMYQYTSPTGFLPKTIPPGPGLSRPERQESRVSEFDLLDDVYDEIFEQEVKTLKAGFGLYGNGAERGYGQFGDKDKETDQYMERFAQEFGLYDPPIEPLITRPVKDLGTVGNAVGCNDAEHCEQVVRRHRAHTAFDKFDWDENLFVGTGSQAQGQQGTSLFSPRPLDGDISSGSERQRSGSSVDPWTSSDMSSYIASTHSTSGKKQMLDHVFDEAGSTISELEKHRQSPHHDHDFASSDIKLKDESKRRDWEEKRWDSDESVNVYIKKEAKTNLYSPRPLNVAELKDLLTIDTKFLSKYWRNDRKNLQCFPYCPEFGDYYSSRINKKIHERSGGTCSAPIHATLRNNSGSMDNLIALGRISLHSKDVERSFAYNHEPNSSGKRAATHEEYRELLKSCVRGEIKNVSDNNKSIHFDVGVWKLNMQLSKTRRPTNVPSKVPLYIFELFVLCYAPDCDSYSVVGRAISSRFSIASTRTLLREMISKEQSLALSEEPTPKRRANDFDMPLKKVKVEHRPASKAPAVPPNRQRSSPVQSPTSREVVSPRIQATTSSPTRMLPAHTSSISPDVPLAEVVEVVTQNRPNPSPLVTSTFAELENERINIVEAWFWCIIAGYVGAHYYYLNRPWMGLLYTFTVGFFGIGWAIDIFHIPWIVTRIQISNECETRKLPRLKIFELGEMYAVALPFGWTGIQRFYLGQYFMGFVYLFTVGLFGVGYLHDLLFMNSMLTKTNEAERKQYLLKYGSEKLREAENVCYRHRIFRKGLSNMPSMTHQTISSRGNRQQFPGDLEMGVSRRPVPSTTIPTSPLTSYVHSVDSPQIRQPAARTNARSQHLDRQPNRTITTSLPTASQRIQGTNL